MLANNSAAQRGSCTPLGSAEAECAGIVQDHKVSPPVAAIAFAGTARNIGPTLSQSLDATADVGNESLTCATALAAALPVPAAEVRAPIRAAPSASASARTTTAVPTSAAALDCGSLKFHSAVEAALHGMRPRLEKLIGTPSAYSVLGVAFAYCEHPAFKPLLAKPFKHRPIPEHWAAVLLLTALQCAPAGRPALAAHVKDCPPSDMSLALSLWHKPIGHEHWEAANKWAEQVGANAWGTSIKPTPVRQLFTFAWNYFGQPHDHRR